MFTTYFYILVLLFQSIYGESNYEYNIQVELVNKYLNERNYPKALEITNKLKRNSIFTNNDIAKLHRKLTLKIDQKKFEIDFQPKSTEDFVLKSLGYYQNREFENAILFSRSGLYRNSVSDTLTKMYELIATQTPNNLFQTKKLSQNHSIKQIKFSEAMNLLELMKRKEKTLF